MEYSYSHLHVTERSQIYALRLYIHYDLTSDIKVFKTLTLNTLMQNARL